jgi:hypothetical protein
MYPQAVRLNTMAISPAIALRRRSGILSLQGLMNKEAAMRYRRIVLEKGGTQNHLDMLENLLGVRLSGENLYD